MTEHTSTILVADADDSTRAFLAEQLTADGYEVLSAARAEEVRARAARGPAALLVLGDFALTPRHMSRRPASAWTSAANRSHMSRAGAKTERWRP